MVHSKIFHPTTPVKTFIAKSKKTFVAIMSTYTWFQSADET